MATIGAVSHAVPAPGHEAEVQRLEAMLDSDERITTTEYARLLTLVGRHDPQRLFDFGDRTYRFGLKQAFRDRNEEAFVELARVGAALLDAAGLADQAIGRLNHALTWLGQQNRGYRRLVILRGVYEAMSGDVERGRTSINSVTDLSAGIRDDADAATGELVTLAFDRDVGSQASAADAALTDGFDSEAGALRVQLIAAKAALGDVDGARHEANVLHATSSKVGHPARTVDAEVAMLALEARREAVEPRAELAADAERLFNSHAVRKLHVTMLHQQSVRRDTDAATATLAALEQHEALFPRGYLVAASGLASFGRTLDGQPWLNQPVPAAPSLFSLEGALASGEAVAMGGTLSDAADWLAWFEEDLPEPLETSLYWPSCRRRVTGLLMRRVGRSEEAIEQLSDAVDCCDRRGDRIEAEIGRAQLAVMRGDSPRPGTVAGVDLQVFGRAAALIAERCEQAGDQFSMIEARVLGRIARGYSRSEIEDELGLRPRASEGPIGRVYRKLGVSGRISAIPIARERLLV